MKVIKQIGGLSMLALLSPSAFALGSQNSSQKNNTPPKIEKRTQSALSINPPVLLDSQPNIAVTNVRPTRRVVILPVETSAVRAASMTEDTRFIYEFDEATNAMIYRPSETKTKPLPNKAKKEFP